LNAEIDNLRFALEGSFSGQIEKGLRLAAALNWYWFGSGNRIEGVSWLNRLLAAEAADAGQLDSDRRTVRQIARGKALIASSYMGILIGQDGQAMGAEAAAIFQSLGDLCRVDLAYSRYLSGEMEPDEGLEIFQELGETFLTCEMAGFLTQRARWRGELDLARRCAERHIQLNRAAGDRDGEASGLWELASLNLLEGNYPQALSNSQACQACFDEQDGDEIYPFPIRFYAWIALVQGDLARAIAYSQAQLNASRTRYSPWIIADALGFLGWEALTSGNIEQAVRFCEEALNMRTQVAANLLSIATYVRARVALARRETVRAQAFIKAFLTDNYHSWPPVQLGIQLSGILALSEGQLARAATLFGAQDAISDKLMNIIPLPEREAYQEALSAVRVQLTAEEFAAGWEKGKAMTTTQAIRYALDGPHQVHPPSDHL
jgi:tetratricopeptide (TPR) repeat protein